MAFPILRLAGDKHRALHLRPMALTLLDQLKGRMQFQGLSQDQQEYTYADGTRIFVRSIPGVDSIDIFVPEGGGKRTIEKSDEFDVFIAYNTPEYGGAWDIEEGEQVPRYRKDVPTNNGDPAIWTTGKDTRINLLKSWTYNLSTKTGNTGETIGKDAIAIYHRKSVNIDEYNHAPGFPTAYWDRPMYYERIEVFRVLNGTIQGIAACEGKACNFFVEPNGKFWLIKLWYNLDEKPGNDPPPPNNVYWALHIQVGHFDTDGTILSDTVYRCPIDIIYSPINDTWRIINGVYNTIAFDGTDIYVGGEWQLVGSATFDNPLIHCDISKYYDYDPVDRVVVSMTANSKLEDIRISYGIPPPMPPGEDYEGAPDGIGPWYNLNGSVHRKKRLIGTTNGICDAGIRYNYWFRASCGWNPDAQQGWNWYASHYDYDDPVIEWPGDPTTLFMGILVWYDYAKREWNSVDISLHEGFVGFYWLTLSVGLRGFAAAQKSQQYSIIDNTGAFYEKREVIANPNLPHWVSGYHPELPDAIYFGPRDGYEGTWTLCGELIAYFDEWNVNPWSYTGCVGWPGSGMSDDYDGWYFWQGWSPPNNTPGHGMWEPNPNTFTSEAYHARYSISDFPEINLHYTVGGYRLINTQDTFDNNRPLFDKVSRFSQRYIRQPDNTESKTNFYRGMWGAEDGPANQVPGGHAKWCTNGAILAVEKTTTTTKTVEE